MTFAKYVMNRFFALAAQNSKAYVELLFWKNVGAVREMTEGYSKDGLVVLPLFCISLGFVYYCILSHSDILQFETLHLILLNVREGKRPTWTEDEEEELRKLYEEHRHSEGLLSFCLFAHLFSLLYVSCKILLHTMYLDLDSFIYFSCV